MPWISAPHRLTKKSQILYTYLQFSLVTRARVSYNNLRLPEEDEEFATMLSGINVIFLGMKVPKHFNRSL